MALVASIVLLAATAAPKVLVVPPEPAGDVGDAAWIAEAVADVLPRDLARLGVPVLDRDERLAAHEALDIPVVTLSRATSVRFAEAVGVARIVSGTFERKDDDLTVSLRWLDVERGTLSPPFLSKAPLRSARTLLRGLAWDIVLAGPWRPGGSREAFLASDRPVPFPAFEAYGRGLASGKSAVRLEHLRRALELHPEYDEARIALGRLSVESRDFAAAHATLAGVGETSPLARAARFIEGVALLEMARYDEAGALYQRLAAAEASPGVLSNHGLSVLRAGEKGPASVLLRRAVDGAPGVTDVAFNLGWALLLEGDAEAATFWLRGVTRMAPRDVVAHVALSWALRRAGHADEAAEEWRGVALLGAPEGLTETPDLARRLGRVMFTERPIAIERSDVDLAAAHVGRADALIRANDVDGALRELTRAAYLDPYSPRAHELLARVHLHRGEKEKALNELQMSLWCRGDTAVRLMLARVLAELGRAAESRVEAQRVLDDEPGNEAAKALLKPGPISDILGENLGGDAMDSKTRREFLITTAAGAAALGLSRAASAADATGKTIPRRTLGKTGLEVSILGFGGGSRFLLSKDEEAAAILERAIAAGINYFDTASSYGQDRRSEKLFGAVLPKYRKSIVLATKTGDRTYDGAMRSIETSLSLLKVDQLDLIQMHSAEPKDDLAAWDKPGGALTAFRKLKDQKVTRFIGFTGHTDAEVHKKVIETFDFDTVLMALNAAKHKSFGEVALPAAVKKEMGVIAMKVARDLAGSGEGKAPIADLLAQTWELPVATLIIGMESLAQIDENVRLAGEYKPGAAKASAERVHAQVASTVASWMSPDYRDACV